MPDSGIQALSVSAVANLLYSVISDNIGKIWVRGEVSNLKNQKNGNAYFSLKDDSSKLNCLIMNFAPAAKSIKELEDGMEIFLYGNVSYYRKEGYISVFVDKVEFIGEGLLKKKFDKLKAQLEKEGLFRPELKKPIPQFPATVGVVTSPTGAAIRDILNVTRRRSQSVNIVVFPAAVQGANAAKEVARAINIPNRYANHFIDVLIVGRGGGSLEDLWCFNEEVVARAIAKSSIPVISAVGHEIDYTIADYVADLRVPTPSAAAEVVVKDRTEVVNYIANLTNRMESLIQNRLDTAHMILDSRGEDALKRTMENKLADTAHYLDNLRIRFDNQMKGTFSNIHHQIQLYKEKLVALNPEAILSRGYSITYKITKDKKAVNIIDCDDVNEGDVIKTVLHKGELISNIKSKGENG